MNIAIIVAVAIVFAIILVFVLVQLRIFRVGECEECPSPEPCPACPEPPPCPACPEPPPCPPYPACPEPETCPDPPPCPEPEPCPPCPACLACPDPEPCPPCPACLACPDPEPCPRLPPRPQYSYHPFVRDVTPGSDYRVIPSNIRLNMDAVIRECNADPACVGFDTIRYRYKRSINPNSFRRMTDESSRGTYIKG